MKEYWANEDELNAPDPPDESKKPGAVCCRGCRTVAVPRVSTIDGKGTPTCAGCGNFLNPLPK